MFSTKAFLFSENTSTPQNLPIQCVVSLFVLFHLPRNNVFFLFIPCPTGDGRNPALFAMYNPLVNNGINVDELPTSTGNSPRISEPSIVLYSCISLTHTKLEVELAMGHLKPSTLNILEN